MVPPDGVWGCGVWGCGMSPESSEHENHDIKDKRPGNRFAEILIAFCVKRRYLALLRTIRPSLRCGVIAMKARGTRLNVEMLEARDVPGIAPPRPFIASPVFHPPPLPPMLNAPIAPARVSPPTTHSPAPHALAGVVTGSYICSLRFGNTNSGYHFHGTATLKGMGQVYVLADVYAVGFATGRGAAGQIILNNGKGSVTIKLSGPIQPKLSPLPTQFQYKIVAATGAYRNLKDNGQLQILRALDRIPMRYGLVFFETGSFRIVIS